MEEVFLEKFISLIKLINPPPFTEHGDPLVYSHQ